MSVGGTLKIVSATERKPERTQYLVLSRDSSADGVTGSWNAVTWDAQEDDVFHAGIAGRDISPGTFPSLSFLFEECRYRGPRHFELDFVVGQGTGNIEIVISDDGGAMKVMSPPMTDRQSAWVLLQKDGIPSRNARADVERPFQNRQLFHRAITSLCVG